MNVITKPSEPAPARPTLRARLAALPVSTQRWLAFLVLLAAGLSLVPWPRATGPNSYQLGMVQPTTVIAEFDFPVLKDPGQLEREQAERAGSVPAVISRVDTASAVAYVRLGRLREQVRTLRLARGSTKPAHGGSEQVIPSFSQETLLDLMVGDKTGPLLEQAGALLQDVMMRGFVSPELASQIAGYRQVRIRDPLGDAIVPTDQLLTAERVRELARDRVVDRDLSPEALAEVTLYCAVPNLSFDPARTNELVQKAVETIEPATGLVLKGEKIVGAHERITPERLRLLRSYEYWKGQRKGSETFVSHFFPSLGRVLILFIGLLVFAAYLKLNRPGILNQPVDFWLLTAIEALVLLLGTVFVRILQLPPALVPVAAVSILVTLLFDERIALAASALPLLLIGVVGDGGMLFVIVVGLGSVVTVLLTHAVRQRSQFFRHLALLPLVHLATLGALALAELSPASGLLRDAAAVAANPFLAGSLALFVLPYVESIFGRGTDISLREYQDLNRPLLRRLMMAAPGTYHHSILVGTLAETGALAVGANPLLARVIGYYHDIGKVAKPEYFQENATIGVKNPHDRLTPSMSRLILESHIREGLTLAKEDRLPREVVQGIREHHGNALMIQPWRRARRQDPQAKAEDYRYPGPRPSSRESALVLLADQVETAARALENPTPSRIKGLIFRVVQENLEISNLDESGLTLSDLARVRDAFVPMLAAAFRGRLQGERGPSERTSSERGFGERGTGERGNGERSAGERGTGDRTTGERGPGERGTEDGGEREAHPHRSPLPRNPR